MKLFLLLACAVVSVLMEVSNSSSKTNSISNSNSNSNTNSNSNSHTNFNTNSNTNFNSNSNSNSMFDTTLDEGWKSWKSFHRKQYEENNENYRRMVWEENMKFIAKHNLEHSMGKHTFTVGMNHFGDLTMKEFAQRLNKFNQKKVGNMTDKLFTAQENTHLPSFVDWRPKGYVTPVKDQGQCGSCWAFSTTGVLEGQVFKKTGKLISLSEQYLMDCSRDAGNHGCNGGYKVRSLLFIKEKGICSEDSYPYTAKNGECKSNRNNIVATCKGVQKILTNSERDLAAAVATVGPISVSIDAEHRAFMLYKSGIFYEPHCSPAKLDHEVLAVGYGTEDQKPYWIIKNRPSIMKFSLCVGCVMVWILALAFGFPFDPSLDESWISWKSYHRKQYQRDDANYRRLIWEKNLRYIEQHNLEHSMGKHTFTVGMNQFGDLTMDEFKQFLNASRIKEVRSSTCKVFTAQEHAQLPPSVDWRPKGYVTRVKDQGQCGSCWAFSTTGVLEGQVFKKTGKLISLSEQYLMDCSRSVGNAGCNGGSVLAGFLFIKERGIASEVSYPYTAKDGNCKFNQSDIVATCQGIKRIPKDSEVDLAAAVATVGPISAGIDAEHRSFMLYKSGIFYEPNCRTVNLDHGILVVGYGMENQKPYWIVKNSWGASWGDEGYVHMTKDMDNNCGIASYAVYPEV